MSLIEVQDNGCGIPKEQMKLALSAHATSKLTQIEDLDQIANDGFSRRGAGKYCIRFMLH